MTAHNRKIQSPPPKVPSVETLPCPSREDVDGGNHRLLTEMRGQNAVTSCVWCRTSWAALDQELRTRKLPR